MSTPYHGFSWQEMLGVRLLGWLQPVVRKPWVNPAGKLAERREPDYPAYPQYPVKIVLEVAALQAAMAKALPQVCIPTLLIHSTGDKAVPVDAVHQIYDRLGSIDKQKLVVEGLDHSMVRDPKRQIVFEAVAQFLKQFP